MVMEWGLMGMRGSRKAWNEMMGGPGGDEGKGNGYDGKDWVTEKYVTRIKGRRDGILKGLSMKGKKRGSELISCKAC